MISYWSERRRENRREERGQNSLAKLLALVRRQLGGAGAHDGVGGRDVDLLGSGLVSSLSCIENFRHARIDVGTWEQGDSLVLVQPALQDLAVVFQALGLGGGFWVRGGGGLGGFGRGG